jgi:hypothetical protein
LRYLEKIGTWAPVGARRYGLPPLSRKELLQQYLKLMEKRARWGELNVSIIFGYVSIELKRLGVK